MVDQFWRDKRGATMVEYGVIVALISVVILTATTSIGSRMAAMMQQIADAFA